MTDDFVLGLLIGLAVGNLIWILILFAIGRKRD